LKFLSGVVDWKAVAGASESEEVKDASNELNEVLGELDRTTRLTASLNAAMDDPEANLAVLSKKLGQSEIRVSELIKQKEALSAKVESARASCAALYDSETVKQLIAANGSDANDIRLRLRAEIGRRIKESLPA
jgi:flagellar motor switch/type III secretory pathway protein FliN